MKNWPEDRLGPRSMICTARGAINIPVLITVESPGWESFISLQCKVKEYFSVQIVLSHCNVQLFVFKDTESLISPCNGR